MAWIPAAGAVGFAVPAVTSWWLALARGWLVAIFAPAVFALVAAYVGSNDVDVRSTMLRHRRSGVGIGVAFGVIHVLTVQRQDAPSRPEGWRLVFDVAWLGVVYGAADAMLMNIIPAMTAWRVFSRRGWTQRLRGKLSAGALALAASMAVIVAYRAGFTEYHGTEMNQPMIGNAIDTPAYALANNPIASLISHIVMHIAAVLRGAETTVQLRPHY